MWLCRLSKQIWTRFCCAVLYFRCITHLVDSCDFFTHILLFCFAGGVGYTKHGIFPTFSSQISNKNILIFVSFSCVLILTSKPHEANSGTYANIYQGFISNLGLNHMQYTVFISNQTKNMWFVPPIRNMNCAITYIYDVFFDMRVFGNGCVI